MDLIGLEWVSVFVAEACHQKKRKGRKTFNSSEEQAKHRRPNVGSTCPCLLLMPHLNSGERRNNEAKFSKLPLKSPPPFFER